MGDTESMFVAFSSPYLSLVEVSLAVKVLPVSLSSPKYSDGGVGESRSPLHSFSISDPTGLMWSLGCRRHRVGVWRGAEPMTRSSETDRWRGRVGDGGSGGALSESRGKR